MQHKIKRLIGYVSKSGKPLYECACKKIIEAWNLVEAYKNHRKQLAGEEDNVHEVNEHGFYLIPGENKQ